MARQTVGINNSRGSALLESLPVMTMLLIFISGVLLVGYLISARAWLQYQSEQALYCLASENPGWNCQTRLNAQLKRYLPWGHWRTRATSTGNQWSVDVQWNYKNYQVHLLKELNPKLLVRKKDLRW